MKGEGVGRTSMHDDRIHPHPALRAGLSLPGRGVPLLLRWEHAAAFCTLPQPSEPLSAPSGGGEGEGEVGDSTIARRRTASPYMPCVRQRALCQAPSRAPSGTGRRGGSRTAHTTCHVASDPVVRSPGSAGVPRVQRTRRDARRERAWYIRSCALPAGNVGATRWVARRGRGARACGMMRDHHARWHQGDAPRRPTCTA